LPRLGLATATADTNQTSGNDTSCTPARCGNLSITYPFSLVGVQPIYCGFPSFQLTCDDANRTYLSRTFRDRIYSGLHIFYGNSSLVVAVEATFAGDGGCRVPDFNVSASLDLLPVDISATNKKLTFVYGCDVPPRLRLQPACDNYTTLGAYTSDDAEPSLGSTNCSSVSVPVRWIEREMEQARLNYNQLVREGFLLDFGVVAEIDGRLRRVQGARRGVQIRLTFRSSASAATGGPAHVLEVSHKLQKYFQSVTSDINYRNTLPILIRKCNFFCYD
jgi:hypothetical protein